MKFISICFLLLFAACTKKTESPVEQPAQVTAQGQGKPVEQEKPEDEISKEWFALWKEKDVLSALKAFQQKRGLFLETNEKVGEPSVLASEGPCGETYMSLVSDAKGLTEKVWEIDSSGKVLREWQPGANEFLGMEKNTLFRKVKFYESISDYDPSSLNKKSQAHGFILGVGADNSIELFAEDKKISGQWQPIEMKCPAKLKIESQYKYCVKDKKSNRLFVLQRTCT